MEIKVRAMTWLKVLLCLFFGWSISSVMANTDLYNKVSLRLGMTSHSFSQLESAFKDKETESGSSSIIVMHGEYEGFTEIDRSFFATASFSGVGGEVEKFYSATGGVKYYFSKYGTKARLSDTNLDLDISPKLAYYAGWEVGAANVIYQAGEEVRSDLGILFGGVAGLTYTLNSKTSYNAEFHVLKGAGVETDFFDVQILFGVSYFIEPLF